MGLAARVLGFARSRGLLAEGERVLVALSGGVDSVVLLDLLRRHAARLGIEVCAAHFDHGMRAESADDAAWVAELCSRWQIPLITARADTLLRSEGAAREARYRFLFAAQRRTDATRIATAHHADDQIETVLLRLLRGAGLRGLSGIPLRRGPFIRPLLRVPKAALLEYATRHQLEYRTDPSNARPDFARNRVRALLIPALAAVRPHAGDAVLSLARYAARTEAAWHWMLQRLEAEVLVARQHDQIQLARPILLEYHPALRARVLRHFLRQYGIVPSRASTHHMLMFCANAESGSAMEVAGRLRLERAFDHLRIERIARAAPDDSVVAITGPSGTGRLSTGGRGYDVAWHVADSAMPDAASFAPALLERGLELRGFRPGDRMRLTYGTKKLKKLFAEQRIAVSERARLPVLADSSGEVLWVAGVARSVHAPVVEAGSALNITVRNAEFS